MASAFNVSFTGFDAEEVDALMNKFYSAEASEDAFDREKAEADIQAARLQSPVIYGSLGDTGCYAEAAVLRTIWNGSWPGK